MGRVWGSGAAPGGALLSAAGLTWDESRLQKPQRFISIVVKCSLLCFDHCVISLLNGFQNDDIRTTFLKEDEA